MKTVELMLRRMNFLLSPSGGEIFYSENEAHRSICDIAHTILFYGGATLREKPAFLSRAEKDLPSALELEQAITDSGDLVPLMELRELVTQTISKSRQKMTCAF